MTRRSICVVTGGRADYGSLRPFIKALKNDPAFKLMLVVAGGHLSPTRGNTAQEIERDGFEANAIVPFPDEGTSHHAVAHAVGKGIKGFSDAFEALRPDLVVLLGDRFEILAAATAASLLRLPLAHLCGGDITEGAIDDVIRHAISKMSHLHFVSNDASARRVVQMGERPEYVFVVGTPSLDDLKTCPLLGRKEVESRLNFQLRRRNLLVTFHPVTLIPDNGIHELTALLNSLDILDDDMGIIFTAPNVDASGAAFLELTKHFADNHSQSVLKENLGTVLFFSTLRIVDAFVGNSSSGLIEAPSLGTPTVNIGERQGGRLQGPSVINCAPTQSEISAAINTAMNMDRVDQFENPYGDGMTNDRIVAALKSIEDFQPLLRKQFHHLNMETR